MTKVKSNLRTAAVCIVITFVCLFGYLLLQNLSVELFARWGFETNQNTNLFTNGFWVTFVSMALVVPLLEELVFRFLSCKLLQLTKMPIWGVITVSAVIFMLYHGSWSQVVYQFLMGLWFAWIYLKTHQIGWTMMMHVINNAFIVTYTYLTGNSNSVFNLNALNVVLALGSAAIATVAVIYLIKKGIPNYEK